MTESVPLLDANATAPAGFANTRAGF